MKKAIRHEFWWIGVAFGWAVAANAQIEFGKTDPDIEFPRLDVTTISVTADVKPGQRTYAVLGKDDAVDAIPDTERLWLNDALLERTQDYTVRFDDGFAVELNARRAPKKNDTLRITVDARRRNLTNGKPFALSDLRGHVLVVDLWATWCGPCVREIPDFIEYQKANAERKFSFIGVSVDNPGDLKDVRDFIAKKRVNYPMLLADRSFVESLMPVLGKRVSGIPTKIVLNRQGKIAFWVIGSPKGSPQETEMRDRLAALLAEPMPIETKPVSVR
jgi:thiol-disulfide isomerase/thioredoxin